MGFSYSPLLALCRGLTATSRAITNPPFPTAHHDPCCSNPHSVVRPVSAHFIICMPSYLIHSFVLSPVSSPRHLSAPHPSEFFVNQPPPYPCCRAVPYINPRSIASSTSTPNSCDPGLRPWGPTSPGALPAHNIPSPTAYPPSALPLCATC